jgi:hypothetical protein
MLLTLAPLVALVAPAVQTPREIELYSLAFGKLYRVTVPEAALDRAPVWKEDADNPPLSARKAIKLAGEARERLFKDSEDWVWHRQSVELCDAGGGRWYWTVTYRAYNTDIVYYVHLPEVHFVVLMDGTVVEPTVVDVKRKSGRASPRQTGPA